MANYATLISSIQSVITTNGNNEITGALLQSLLVSMVNSLGDGYQFHGIAKPSTNPGTPDQNVFYIAAKGTYPNFGGLTVEDSVAILKYNGTWTKESSTISNVADTLNKLIIKPGKNLFNRADYLSGKYINTSGGLGSHASYGASGFFPVAPETAYWVSSSSTAAVGASSVNVAYYDSGLNLISTEAMGKKNFTTPAGAAFMRISFYTSIISSLQVEIGSERTSYESYNPLYGYSLASIGLLMDGMATRIAIKPGKNLFDRSSGTSGKYINTSGGLSNSSSYGASSFFPVAPETAYWVSAASSGNVGASTVNVAYYDSELNLISTEAMGKKSFTTPAGAAYMRISYYLNLSKIQVEIGSARTSYESFSPISGYNLIIPDNAITTTKVANSAITYDKLSPGVQQMIEGGGSGGDGYFHCSQIVGNLLAGGILKTSVIGHIRKNVFLSAKIGGNFTLVRVGVGGNENNSFRELYAYWLEIDSTNVKICWYNGSADVTVATYAHGLQIGQNTVVEIYSNQSTTAMQPNIRIYDDMGGIFSHALSSWGYGTPFVENASVNGSINVELTFMPRDLTKKIWLFGDSYIDLSWNGRWPYYVANQGLINYLVNSKPGLSPAAGLADLQSLLTLGHVPTFLLWTLGMNGPGNETQSGGEYVINPEQKAVIDSVVSICDDAHITLILATIPTVPTLQKTGLSNYVRGLGYRYIDFAMAVRANSNGEWASGLLSNDGVHPSEAGAAVLASQVLIDFPEISLAV